MTLKQTLGKWIMQITPLSKRNFNLLRYEAGMISRRMIHPFSLHRIKTLRMLNRRSGLSVNVGSGGKGLPDWVNIDAFPRPDSTFDLDIRKPFPLRTGSVDRILAEHVIEHIDFHDDVPKIFKEFHRLLSINGILRVIVPDAAKYLAAYCRTGPTFADLGYDLQKLSNGIPTQMALINHMFHQGGEHCFSYDFETMEWCLRQAGFTKVRRCSYRQSSDPQLQIDQPNHEPYSLYVEAER